MGFCCSSSADHQVCPWPSDTALLVTQLLMLVLLNHADRHSPSVYSVVAWDKQPEVSMTRYNLTVFMLLRRRGWEDRALKMAVVSSCTVCARLRWGEGKGQ